MSGPVGALEIGGTHVTSALVSIERRTVERSTVARVELAADADRDVLVRTIVGAAHRLPQRDVVRWGVATPGPFDYARGISLIRGVAKLDALYGVDLRHELATVLKIAEPAIVFVNDADAFLIGEWWAGAARGHARAMGITLGTGLGSAFMVHGGIVETGAGVPPEGRLDLIPFRGAPVEETLSRRALRAAYGGDGADVVEIASRARAGERHGVDVLRRFGGALGEFLAPWTVGFAPTCVVIGGSIARSWDLWSDDFRAAGGHAFDGVRCGVAAHLEEAPLLGAACRAADAQ